MEDVWQFIPYPWLIVGGLVSISVTGMYLVKRFVLVQLQSIKRSEGRHVTSILLNSLSKPLSIFILVLNIYLLQYLLLKHELIADQYNKQVDITAQIGIIIALLVFAERFCNQLVVSYADSSDVLRNSQSIIRGTSKLLIISIGSLVILGTLGISITPIVASLGITSLAVALALQPTLENFFSGVQLVIDKPIRVGDFVELDSGEQGFVEKIGWRSTWIKMLPNNIVVMPNSILSQSKVINYYYPEKELSVPVDVGVHYDSDLEHVERVTLEVAKEILHSHKWGISDYDTFVVFHTFDSSSINFTVMLRAEEYFNRFFIKSAFIKALHARYRQEGIVIPYPIRAINTEQEKAEPSKRNTAPP
ncbi:MAG: mechanosensitive ion channel family protein [Paraglaciecola chathamensis]|jgi:small-conductance mechanosensitive channel|uniref:Small-conductance mechanosensitive channel n=1 Tax=Paraglaciecola agarilytica NO2 TaxID=1125747 RepID=A0ABQ0I3V6_9ALTE|nr:MULTISPECIES: mechanosensitive ion channel family protein [Paraglaciecola]AEE22667.1 MscS Mechanosensitive ion channel [Glaciecola sp. 4H-3-7+YE-5]MDO6558587.1 mechanosensitive ion channel family protein [Paraglaciecola chathamensis]GAC04012.1 MscS Mechanosensitive ion channel [Paraglaciecola agarilytica NO2]